MVKKKNHHTVTVDPSSPNQRKLPHWLTQCLVLQARNSAGSTTPFRWVLISPLCALLHVLPASSNWPYTLSLSSEKNTQACIRTHTCTTPFCGWCVCYCASEQSQTDWGATHLFPYRLGKAAITCNIPHLYKARATTCKNTLGKSHTNPVLIKTT